MRDGYYNQGVRESLRNPVQGRMNFRRRDVKLENKGVEFIEESPISGLCPSLAGCFVRLAYTGERI